MTFMWIFHDFNFEGCKKVKEREREATKRKKKVMNGKKGREGPWSPLTRMGLEYLLLVTLESLFIFLY